MRILRSVLIAAGALALFAAGAVTAVLRGWGQPVATFDIANASGQAMTRLTLTVTSGGATSVIQLAPPAVGQSVVKRVFLASEGGYALEAVLSDGQTIASHGGYIEAGYASYARIQPRDIVYTQKIGMLP